MCIINIEKLKLLDIPKARKVFKENYKNNGGVLLVESVAPNLFNYRNMLVAKNNLSGEIIAYLHIAKNVKYDKKDMLYSSYNWNSNSNYYLAQIAVLNNFKNKGVARNLMDFTINSMGKGIPIYAHIADNNTRSKDLLHKYNFIEIGKFEPKFNYHGIENYKATIYRLIK